MPSWRSSHSTTQLACSASACKPGISLVIDLCSKGVHELQETGVCHCHVEKVLWSGHKPMRLQAGAMIALWAGKRLYVVPAQGNGLITYILS